MGNSYGRNVLGTVGKSIQLSADGKPEMKSGGVTVDWALFTAHSGADLVLEDGVTIKDGEKYIRYGQCITKVVKAEVQVIDLSGADDPNGGAWVPTVPGFGAAVSQVWNVTAAALQAALELVVGAGLVAVSKSGFQYSVTFDPSLGNVATITTTHTLTTAGSTITISVTTSTQGAESNGKYGPADTTASDGRQTLTRGSIFLVNETIKESDLHSDHPPALEGGKVWKARILLGGNNPTLANIEAAMPRLKYADG